MLPRQRLVVFPKKAVCRGSAMSPTGVVYKWASLRCCCKHLIVAVFLCGMVATAPVQAAVEGTPAEDVDGTSPDGNETLSASAVQAIPAGSSSSTRVVVTLNEYNACDVGEALWGRNNNKTDALCGSVAKCYGRRLILNLEGCDVDVQSSTALQDWARSSVAAYGNEGSAHVISIERDALTRMRTEGMMSRGQYQLATRALVAAAAANHSETMVDTDGIYSFITQYQWNMDMIRARELWTNYSSQGQNTTIAVLDSGMGQGAVNAFDGRIAGGYDFVSDDFWSKDGDGRDPNYYDPGDASEVFCPGDGDSWHGTAVASVAAGDFEGYEGVAPMASVLPVRVLGMCGMGYASDLADGIVWAAGGQIDGVEHSQKPAGEQRRVILMSLSGEGACPSFMQTAVDLAVGKGVALFAAAGNDPALNASDQFPGNCKGVVTVGAWNWKKEEASYSSRNPDIFMPGGDGEKAIPVLINDLYSGVWGMIGTSFAAPHAAGLWAVMGCQGDSNTSMMEQCIKQLGGSVAFNQNDALDCQGNDCHTSNDNIVHASSITSNPSVTPVAVSGVPGSFFMQWTAGIYQVTFASITTVALFMIGGGGGSGQDHSGGGGAGAHLHTNSYTFPAGTYSFNVGSGGAGELTATSDTSEPFAGGATSISKAGFNVLQVKGGARGPTWEKNSGTLLDGGCGAGEYVQKRLACMFLFIDH